MTHMCYYRLVPRDKGKKQNVWLPPHGGRKEGIIMKKFCTKCGKQFEATGREVICPSCKAQAAEETKRAAVLRAKRASWTGESVPVRISGRASTIIRRYGAAHNLPFAAALDELLKATSFFEKLGVEWEEVEPYKSHRRDKHTTETAQDAQDAQEVKQESPQDVQAARKASKATTSKATNKAAGKAASKASASKAAAKKE